MRLLSRKKPFVFNNPANPTLERGRREDCEATWWIQATPGTTYWRCLVPARHLPGQALNFEIDDLVEKKGVPVMPRHRGVAIWQFLGDEARTRVSLGMGQIHGTRTLMEVDDNYMRNAPYMRAAERAGKAPWYKTYAESIKPGRSGYSNEVHRKVVPWMDGIICSTEYLADIYSEFNQNVYVCPNSVDPVDWQTEREEHEPLRIVYYGSTSHTEDTPLVTDALKWASKQDGVEVWTVGFKNPAWSFPHQAAPWEDYLDKARAHLFRFDVGIAPLRENAWANGKSDVKALEYAMAGVMPILQNAEPYRPWDEAGWEWMCKTKGDWMEAIQEIVRNREWVPEYAASAKAYVEGYRTIEHSIENWREAVHGA